MVNTTEMSMRGSDAAFLSNYFDHLLSPPYGIGQAIIFCPVISTSSFYLFLLA